jgi:Predicted nucleic acid-binding protein, contains PIN domain
VIADTSFILDLVDGRDAAIEKAETLEAEGVPLVLPVMTVLELYVGVGKTAATRRERQQLEATLGSYPLAEMTPSVAQRAGRLLGERMAETPPGDGSGIGKGDAAIAATALERDEPVLTADRQFESVPGLTVETYR